VTKTYKIAAIPADGIGVEVIAAGIEVLDALAEKTGTFQFHFDHFDWGSDYYKKHGVMMPADGREQIRNHDGLYNHLSDILPGLHPWAVQIRLAFDLYLNGTFLPYTLILPRCDMPKFPL